MLVENDSQPESDDLMEAENNDIEADTYVKKEKSGFTHSRQFLNKENVTPPEDHSTPALRKLVRKLDDSLFGFNTDVDSSLPFSPVVPHPPSPAGSSKSIGTASTCASTTSTSPVKRKLPGYGIFDIPIEMPQKRQKKKKKASKEQVRP